MNAENKPGGGHMLVARLCCCLGLLLLAEQSLTYYPMMPPLVASHFAISGAANAFMPKALFFGFMWVVYGIVFTYALLGTRLFPKRVKIIADKEFWLAPDRREETLAVYQKHVAWEGALALGFLYLVVGSVVDANLHGGGTLDVRTFLPVLVAFISLILLLRLRLRAAFARRRRGIESVQG